MNTEHDPYLGREFDVIVVGAGPAGLGVAIVLDGLGLDYLVLDRDRVGSSFRKWPKESRLISPSFTGNFFNMPDLNCISPDSSPAFNLLTEHPTGDAYAAYLEVIEGYHELDVQTGVEVTSLQKDDGAFILDTNAGKYKSTYVIWAAGEFQYPKRDAFEGDELCVHFSEVPSFADLAGEERIVIGGYESGFDASLNMIKAGKKATIIDSANFLELVNSDSSYSLSPFTRDRISQASGSLTYHKEMRVEKVELRDGNYVVTTSTGMELTSAHQPINCTGFASSITLVSELFDHNEGYPVLNEVDESSKTENLFLVGPQVKHGNALFCFIYKYRQRFAIVGEEIAKRENVAHELIHELVRDYQANNFYISDLSCCDGECAC